jgi:enamine deaminase RidA (YjgF/YER057c/UK114 family)
VSVIRRIQPEGLFANPAYTHVVAAQGGQTVYISGQVSTGPDGAVVGVGDLAAQTTQVMRNLQAALGSVGATFADGVKITTFVVGYQPEHRAVISAGRSPFFPPGAPPASTLVGVEALAAPEWLIEIEAVAVID